MKRREFLLAGSCSTMLPSVMWDQEIPHSFAESAHINGASADGRTAFIMRLARYPMQSRAWLWVFVFCPDGAIYSYIDDKLALSGSQGVTPVEGERVVYELPAVPARLERQGRRAEIANVSAAVTVRGHRSTNPPVGAGSKAMSIEARFRPAHLPQLTPGRTEVLGRVEAVIEVDGERFSMSGGGHWHEQNGDRPNFAPTLTYATLRGEKISLIAIASPAGDKGFVVRDSQIRAVEKFVIGPLGPERAFRLQLAGGEAVAGVFKPAHNYTMTIDGRSRPGAIGVAQTQYGSLSGMINDWKAL